MEREKRISKSLETAIEKACESYGGCTVRSGGFEVEGGGADAAELRSLLDLWWRFNLLAGMAAGESNSFAEGYQFESFDAGAAMRGKGGEQ